MWKFSPPACNLCGSKRAGVLFRWRLYPDGRVGDVLKCADCGLVYRQPVFDHNDNRIITNSTRFRPDAPARFDARRRSIYERILKTLERYRRLNRVLDVGSGYGHFLSMCKDYGWEATGVEPKPEWSSLARTETGLRLINTSFESAELPHGYFDVVTFVNVLEHLDNPLGALIKAKGVLRNGGAVLIRTPNAAFHVPMRHLAYRTYGWCKGTRRFDVSNINLYCFSANTISSYLKKAGFAYARVEDDTQPLSEQSTWRLSVHNTARDLLSFLASSIAHLSAGRWLLGSALLACGQIKSNGEY